jgi:hypothetical protein
MVTDSGRLARGARRRPSHHAARLGLRHADEVQRERVGVATRDARHHLEALGAARERDAERDRSADGEIGRGADADPGGGDVDHVPVDDAALEGLEPDRPVRFGPWSSAPIPCLHARVLIADTNLRPRPRPCQAARP